MSASEVEEQTHTNTPRAGHTLSAGGGESAAARCPAHPPARHRLPSTGIRAPGLWRSSVGAREGEPSRVGPLLRQLPTTTPQRLFFSCYLCSEKAQLSSWKRCLLPRTAWDLGLRLSLPGLGAQSVWARLGTGRWQGFGPQPQPGRKAPGGGREPLGRQLWPPV